MGILHTHTHTHTQSQLLGEEKREDSFTLIELLIVIAIIGILAALIIVNVVSADFHVRDTKRIADVTEIAKALNFYYLDNASYPSLTQNSQDTTTPVGCWGGWVAGTTLKSDNSNFLPQLVAGGYLAHVPLETHPLAQWSGSGLGWGSCSYRYVLSSCGGYNYASIYTTLENYRPGPIIDQRQPCFSGWGEGSPTDKGYLIQIRAQ